MWWEGPPKRPVKDTGQIPNDFEWNVFKRIRNTGPMGWDAGSATNPIDGWPLTRSELDAVRHLLKEKRLELEHDDKLDDLVIRAPMVGPPAPVKPKVISNDDTSPGYEETPALLALRARRRALGR